MKLKPLLLAMAALSALSAGAAQAQYVDTTTNVYLTGASAIRNNVATSIRSLCTTGDGVAPAGTLTVFKNGSSTSSLANQMAYVCNEPMAGTLITTVLHTVTGGSLNSILGMSNDGAKQQVPVSLTVGCTAAVPGSGLLAGYSVRANCALEAAAAASDGGYSDVEAGPVVEQVASLTSGTDGFTYPADVTQGFTGVAQVFGLAVSEKMYKDLQTVQGLIAAGCTSGDPLPACQPSLNRADVVSLINNNEFAPHKNGAEAIGLDAGASIQYARRVTTSGTQSSAQILFLGKGCLTGPNFGEVPVIGDELAAGTLFAYTPQFSVSANSGSSDVISRLVTAGNTAYAFGWLSGENRSSTATSGFNYHFIKINDVGFSDGTSTGLNKANAISGDYEFFVEAVSYKGPVATKTDTNEAAIIDAISTGMGTPTSLGGPVTTGLFIVNSNPGFYTNASFPTEVSNFQRGGGSPNSCAPVNRP